MEPRDPRQTSALILIKTMEAQRKKKFSRSRKLLAPRPGRARLAAQVGAEDIFGEL
ncbi:MAG: hypothetical protein LBR11_05060 [Deltaproteobacteria bacterium]|nr:hypothetical protein [Deltaproteobacteria bacterium]